MPDDTEQRSVSKDEIQHGVSLKAGHDVVLIVDGMKGTPRPQGPAQPGPDTPDQPPAQDPQAPAEPGQPQPDPAQPQQPAPAQTQPQTPATPSQPQQPAPSQPQTPSQPQPQTPAQTQPQQPAPQPPAPEPPPEVTPSVLASFDTAHFETAKAFPLEESLDVFRAVAARVAQEPQRALLVVGHTDTVGPADYNLQLSQERAASVAAYLVNDVESWMPFYKHADAQKRWGTREDQHMLRVLPFAAAPYYDGKVDGQAGPKTQAALKRFQQDHGLNADGKASDEIRRALVLAYMKADGTTVPSSVALKKLGCGLRHLEEKTGPGVDSPKNRRVDVFAFESADIKPAPEECEKNPHPGCDVYEKWKAEVTGKMDLPPAPPEEDLPDPDCPDPGSQSALDTSNALGFAGGTKSAASEDDQNFAMCIQGVLKPDQFILDMPVRDLTRADALRIVVWRIQQGDVKLHGQKLKFDGSCNLLFPTAGSKLNIEPQIGGVTWTNIAFTPPRTHFLGGLDPRGVVLLWKASIFLRDEFGVTAIHHPGFTGGGGQCHVEGRAIDFSGCEGTFPDPFTRDPALKGRPFKVNIFKDWGQRPVPSGAGLGSASYRLAADKTLAFTAATPPSADEVRRAAAILFGPFYDEFVAPNSSDQSEKKVAYDPSNGSPTGVYDPASGATSPGTDPNLPTSTVGQTQRFAIGPDFGRSAKLRADHQNHIHFQVSTTGSEPHPP